MRVLRMENFTNTTPSNIKHRRGIQWLYRLFVALFWICPLYSQHIRFEDKSWPSIGEARGAFVTEYVNWPFSLQRTLRSNLLGNYQLADVNIGFILNMNRKLSFDIKSGRVLITVPDSAEIIRQPEIKIPPNTYEFDYPVGVWMSYKIEPIEFSLSTRLFTQSETIGSIHLVEMNPNVFYINTESISRSKTDILLAGTVGYCFNGITAFAGVTGLRLMSWGDDSLKSIKMRPLIGLEWPMLGSEFLFETNLKEIGFLHSTATGIPWLLENRSLRLYTLVKANFDVQKYQSLEFNVQIPFIQGVDLLLGYRKVWNQVSHFGKTEFNAWRSTFSTIIDGDPSTGIQRTAIKFGVSVNLGSNSEEFPIHLIGSKIFHRSIYTAKKDFYAYNPIGTVDIHNTGKKTIDCQVSIELPEELGSYRSESLKIGADEIRTVPVFLYLSEKRLAEPSSPVQLNIAVEMGEKKHTLSSVPVTVFDVHSWDGSTWGLRYYLTPDEPTIQMNAKRKYIQSLVSDSISTDSQKKLTQLTNFLQELGRNLHYVQDPTSSLYVDRVQYPIETMELQSGDCEDLAVYFASHLMAVGIQCAFVDVKPQVRDIGLPTAGQRQLGHIFILVNTEINPEFIGDLGLTEFQFVSRKSATGKTTIWLPIETTVLDQGFTRAFHDGVQQYYEKVIIQNGINNGSIHVYDF